MPWNILTLLVLWAAFFAFWFASYFTHSAPQQKKRERRWYLYAATVVFITAAIGQFVGNHLLTKVTLHGFSKYAVKIFGIALVAAGLFFAVWARITLASNWSGAPAFIKGQAVIIKGPYALVRHPIYTGVIAMLWGSFFAGGFLFLLLAALLGSVMLYFKARLEEALLLEHLGDEYGAFMKVIPMLLPSLRFHKPRRLG